MDGSFAGTVAVVGYAVTDHSGNGANIDNTGGSILLIILCQAGV